MKRTFDQTVGSIGGEPCHGFIKESRRGVDFIVDSRGGPEAKRRPERRQVKWEDFGEES